MLHQRPDPNSFANFEAIRQDHVHFEWYVDFKRQVLDGFVVLDCVVVHDATCELVCDNRNLGIHAVHNITHNCTLPFQLQSVNDDFGLALVIKFQKVLNKGERVQLKIHYTTSPKASGIQWLMPAQTAGGQLPYLFTQNQAIHARSCAPLQDSPAVKFTYTANVTVPKHLVALVSATATGSTDNADSTTTFTFEQKVRMPSYLVCLAVGDLVKRDLSHRCAVWSEREMIDAAHHEFMETEMFLAAGEKVCGPYVWGRYDILMLPPSFPYGGMENPQLTFVTPTLLAGDRSLANVVAHEIAHSWTGNLVTNKTWEYFWLNEGFTVYVERRIIEEVYDVPTSHFYAIEGLQDLAASVEHLGAEHPFTALYIKLDGIDPDDSFSAVPYEKGFNFLFYLESLVGQNIFRAWLKQYLSDFAYQSITQEMWRNHLETYVAKHDKAEVLKDVDWNTWIFKPGMPPVSNAFVRTQTEIVESLASRWLEHDDNTLSTAVSPKDVSNFISLQMVVFLNALAAAPKPLSHAKIKALDSVYGCSKSGNCEIKCAFFIIALKANFEPLFESIAKFITEQGRMKYVRPLYRALVNTGPKGRKLAQETFLANK